jgi:ribonuclease D
MDSLKLDHFGLIQHESDLPALSEKLHSLPKVAVDTESNSLYAYRERVCLIQFSSDLEDFLVDPLALPDLTSLKPIFSDPKIEKVFHAAEYDLLCLRRDFDIEVNNLFDTMIAARILGRKEIGLGALLEAEFGIKLDKRYQRANWGQRPLPNHLLDYARMDTHYLIHLRQRLGDELEKRRLIPLAQEDFCRLIANIPEANGDIPGLDRPINCWRISGSYDLEPQQAAVLKELCKFRDDTARQLDRPLFKVMNDHTLLAIASGTPHDIDDLRRLPGMSSGQVRRYGQQLLKCVQRGLEAAPVHPPRSNRPDPAFSERLDILRSWRKKAAAQMGVPSDVILPRDLMQDLAHKSPLDRRRLEQVMHSVPWRLDHFGSQILGLLSGH